MTFGFRLRLPFVAVFLLAGACHSWVTDRQALGRPIPERARVLLWTHGEDREVHGVRVRGDSIIAVPYWLPPDCDSCSVRLPLTAVDSIQIAQPDETKNAILGTALLALAGAIIWLVSVFASWKD